MNDDNRSLPIKSARQSVVALPAKRGSLVMRGMVAVQHAQQLTAAKNAELVYRLARVVYNRLTDFGHGDWFGYEDRISPLTDVLNSFDQLAAQGYGKAFFPLSTLYSGRQSLKGDPVQSARYRNFALEWLHANEHLNDPEIWHDLGVLFVGENDELAVTWFRKAADVGDADSMWMMSGAYEFGMGAEQDWATSLRWQIKAAEAGHQKAQQGLVVQHDRGDLDIDDVQVFNWYVWSAEHGHLWAQLYLAGAYSFEEKLEEDDTRAAYWYRKAAEQGNAEAQFALGEIYLSGRGVTEDSEQGFLWVRKAAEQGDAQHQWMLGLFYEHESNYEEAVYWYRQAAEQGDSYAQGELGKMCKDGRGIAQDDKQAVYWLRQAAEQGDAESQWMLSGMYRDGRGVTEDSEQGFLWLRKAAEQGHAGAQRGLGLALLRGRGVEQDIPHAIHWLRKAAEQGSMLAKVVLKEQGINWETQ